MVGSHDGHGDGDDPVDGLSVIGQETGGKARSGESGCYRQKK